MMLEMFFILFVSLVLIVTVHGHFVSKYYNRIYDDITLDPHEKLKRIDALPSFTKMYLTFWVWPISRFEPDE